MGQKRRNHEKDDFEYDPAPKHLHVAHIKKQEKRLIIILEKAQLESVKVRLYFVYNFKFEVRIQIFGNLLLFRCIYLNILIISEVILRHYIMLF